MPAAAPSSLHVRLFARYAELVGAERVALRLSLPATVEDVLRALRAAHPGADAFPERPVAAVNLRHVGLDHVVQAGDEIAFLPPVAGG